MKTNNKCRTITLTNRAPIRIVEDDWPVIAQVILGQDADQTAIEIRVRRHVRETARYIVHANFQQVNDEKGRVGRLVIVTDDDERSLWECISAVGDDLRERIGDSDLRECVIDVVDKCFANLPPCEV